MFGFTVNNLILQEEKYASCDIVEENKTTIGLDCNVGNLYLPALAKVNESPLSPQKNLI